MNICVKSGKKKSAYSLFLVTNTNELRLNNVILSMHRHYRFDREQHSSIERDS